MAKIPDLKSLCSADDLNVTQGFAIAERLYSAAFRGDWADIEEMMSDDFVIREAEGLPFRGTFSGKSALRHLYAHMTSFWIGFRADITAITVGNGYIVGLLQATGRSRDNGEAFSMPIAEVIRIRDGLIVEIYPMWWDTKVISEMFVDRERAEFH